MKKILVFLAVMTFMFGVVGATAIGYSTSLSTTGSAIVEISTEHATGTHSARLLANEIVSYPPTHEARVRIKLETPMLLSNFNSMSWKQYVKSGYMAHLDVFLDNNEVLIFEGAKSTASGSGYCDAGAYETGDLITFGPNRGTEINGITYAWKNGNIPGPCGNDAFEAIHNPLSEWKTTYNNDNVKITKFEIEVDGWIDGIPTHEAFIDDITLNGNVIEDFEGQIVEVSIEPDLTLIPTPNPLDFGLLKPGMSSEKEVTLTHGTSNIDVSVSIVGSGFMKDIETHRTGSWTKLDGDSFIMMGVNSDLVFNTKLLVPIGTSSGDYSTTIVYTVNEHT